VAYESFAQSDTARRRFQRQRRRDTAPELAVRRAAHVSGLRYFVHRRPLPDLRREADLIFPGARVAVFIDGCFWHGCPRHGRSSHRVNNWYWPAKIQRNMDRDRDTDVRLSAAGWRVVRIWEHEDPTEAAARIREAVRAGSLATARARQVADAWP
jgi:DNA mismatch endonuclease (patch repair protein)